MDSASPSPPPTWPALLDVLPPTTLSAAARTLLPPPPAPPPTPASVTAALGAFATVAATSPAVAAAAAALGAGAEAGDASVGRKEAAAATRSAGGTARAAGNAAYHRGDLRGAVAAYTDALRGCRGRRLEGAPDNFAAATSTAAAVAAATNRSTALTAAATTASTVDLTAAAALVAAPSRASLLAAAEADARTAYGWAAATGPGAAKAALRAADAAAAGGVPTVAATRYATAVRLAAAAGAGTVAAAAARRAAALPPAATNSAATATWGGEDGMEHPVLATVTDAGIPPPLLPDDDAVVVAPVGAAGRGVIAARPLPAGSVVLVEAPVATVAVMPTGEYGTMTAAATAAGVPSPSLSPVCDHCYGELPLGAAAAVPCTASATCGVAYCGWSCALAAAADGGDHPVECGDPFWAAAPPGVRLAVRVARALGRHSSATARPPPLPPGHWAVVGGGTALSTAAGIEALDAHEVNHLASAVGVRTALGHTLDAVLVVAAGRLPPLTSPRGGGVGAAAGAPPVASASASTTAAARVSAAAAAALPPVVRLARLLLIARTNAIGIPFVGRGRGGGEDTSSGGRVATGLYARAALFNHHPTPGVTWTFGPGAVLTATTTRQHSQGEELCVNYWGGGDGGGEVAAAVAAQYFFGS
ncbi:hypothetical protein MMPV_007921 [Pyropia vietnamensis]